jgi:hypothetical protein
MKIEDELREALRVAADTARPSMDAWERIENRRRGLAPISLRRRMGVALLAAIIGLAGVLFVVRAFDRGDGQVPRESPSSSDRIGTVRTIDLGWDRSVSSTAISARDGYALVSGTQHTPTLMIGPNGERSTLPFEQGPDDLTSTSSAIWAVGYQLGTGSYVARFAPGNPVPNLMIPMANRGLDSLLATDTAIWVFGYDDAAGRAGLGTLLQLDPTSGSIVKELTLDDLIPGPAGANRIRFGSSADDTAVWMLIAEPHNGLLGPITLVRMDTSTYDITTYDPGSASELLAANGVVWLPAENGPIRLDPETGRKTPLPVPDPNAVPFAATPDAVWCWAGTPRNVQLFRMDFEGGEPTAVGLRVDVRRQPDWGSVDVVYDGAGKVWLLYEGGPLQEVTVGTPTG